MGEEEGWGREEGGGGGGRKGVGGGGRKGWGGEEGGRGGGGRGGGGGREGEEEGRGGGHFVCHLYMLMFYSSIIVTCVISYESICVIIVQSTTCMSYPNLLDPRRTSVVCSDIIRLLNCARVSQASDIQCR